MLLKAHFMHALPVKVAPAPTSFRAAAGDALSTSTQHTSSLIQSMVCHALAEVNKLVGHKAKTTFLQGTTHSVARQKLVKQVKLCFYRTHLHHQGHKTADTKENVYRYSSNITQ
jgi:hypothetical protein